MTLQTKALQWSMGIHILLFLGIFILSSRISAPVKLTVIDFSLVDMPATAPGSLKGPPSYPGNPLSRPERRVTKSQPVQKKAQRERVLPKIPKPRPKTAAVSKKKTPQPVPRPEAKPVSRPQRASVHHPSEEPQSPPMPELFPRTEIGTASRAETGSSYKPEVAGRAQGATGSTPTGRSDHAGLGNGGKAPGAGSNNLSSKEIFLKEHFAYIRDLIQESLRYPMIARNKGWSGQVKIGFVLCTDGSADSVKVLKSSGFSVLDKSAVDTVKKVSPFPLPPVKAEIIVPITYALK